MGKIKKSPSTSKDEGQKKISNFFQKQSEKPAGKALFSEHGRTSKEKTDVPVSKLKGDNSMPSSVAESKPSSVTCIPETQVLFTPPSVKSSSNTTPSNRDGSDLFDNNDFEVIPDTPKGKQEETVKAKRPLARSFLLSTTQMGSNPIQKAKENREAKLALKKKKACLAKQGLLSISVKFNDPSNVADENNGNAVNHLADNNNAVIDEVDNAVQMNDGKDILKPEGFTPTKIYSNGDSMKRMAKSGDSPTGKRTMCDSDSIKKQLNYFKDSNESSHSDKDGSDMTQLKPNDIPPEFESEILAIKASEMELKKSRQKALEEERKQKEKEKLLERKRLEREEKRRKSEKLMKYQVGGSTAAADKHRDLSLANDDALDDILQELSSPSVLKSTKITNSSMLKLSKPANQILTKKLPHSFTKTKTLAKNNIVINSAIPNPSSESRLGDKKLENSKSADNNVCIDDWTDEDDEYLNKLDLDLNSNKNKLIKPTVIETDDIETFPTQGHHGGQRSRTQEMEIEEFATQQSKDSLINEMAGLSPFKQSKHSTLGQTEAPCTQYGRHVVTNIELSSDKHQMILSLLSQPDNITRTCILHDFWLDSHIEVGDTVHVLAEFIDNVCHITDKSGLLVINPDLLLSGTTVVSSVFCMRKSILKEKFKGCDSRNVQMLYGSIIHSVFQQMLKNKLHTADHITAAAKKIVYEPKNLLEMYANNVSEDKVMEEIKSYIPQMMSWVEKYTQFAATSFNKKLNDGDVQLTKVYDIEENIWSPRFGIKGKIDLTVEARTKQDRNTTLLPLELKTGKTSYSVEHKGQVTLYSMMCGDRRKDPGKGLLLYLKEPSMKIIPAEHLHQRGLIQLRNEMSYYISRQVQKCDSESQTYTLGRLPDPITNIRACQKCPQLVNCSIYQRQVEGRSPDSSGASGLVSETLGHLTTDHMTYFLKWCLMLDLETKLDQSKKTVADIWCKSSIQREEVGLCLGGMTLIPDSCKDLAEDSVILSFCRQKGHNKSTLLHHTGICKQDSVVISCESPAWVAVCTGFVHDISPTAIHILSERESVDRLLKMKDCIYRIDKCDNFSTAGIMYTNVSKLMTDDPHSLKLRRLIIDKVKPEFVNTLSKANIEKVKNIFKVLNKPQKSAILKVLMCKDYVLIRGYPGTGKTSTIVALVKVLHALGQSVLLTSYTHSAVDNILLKLKKDGVNFLRLGRISKVHRDIQQYTWEKQTSSLSSVEDIEKFITKQQIVASSCLGMNHQVFTRRQFDVCIIDEASQVQQPACLGPVFLSTRFILVGDPKQLPPVVRSKEAKDLGMDESLFSHLDDLGATFDLNVQYRMNSAIMAISNSLVYNGCLKCGNDSVANRTLNIPRPDVTESVVINIRWMKDVYDSDLSKSVIMLDTQKLSANHKQVKTGGFTNETECQLVIKCVNNLCKAGIAEDDIGVIAPYNSQVNLIRDRLSHGRSSSKVEVNTVDQYQGRDKNIIIISFVMSSDQNSTQVGELLRDIRRLNVAMTRAKMKLVLIGNVSFLRQYMYLKQVLDLIASDNINMLTEV